MKVLTQDPGTLFLSLAALSLAELLRDLLETRQKTTRTGQETAGALIQTPEPEELPLTEITAESQSS